MKKSFAKYKTHLVTLCIILVIVLAVAITFVNPNSKKEAQFGPYGTVSASPVIITKDDPGCEKNSMFSYRCKTVDECASPKECKIYADTKATVCACTEPSKFPKPEKANQNDPGCEAIKDEQGVVTSCKHLSCDSPKVCKRWVPEEGITDINIDQSTFACLCVNPSPSPSRTS